MREQGDGLHETRAAEPGPGAEYNKRAELEAAHCAKNEKKKKGKKKRKRERKSFLE
jgi:hypothetical protein